MHVPVLLTRQVLVNGDPAARLVLSGIVTSATNAALLVQLGSLAGCVGRGVVVGASVLVSVTALSVTAGVSERAASVAAGACVWVSVTVTVTVAVAVAGSVVACALQLEMSIVASNAIM